MHKFASSHRYLSYLRQSADEQRAMLRALERGDGDLERLVEISKGAGRFMSIRQPDVSLFEKGQLFDVNRASRGLDRPPLRPLSAPAVIEQTGDPRGLDWHALERHGRPFRWSGPSPRPKILIPFVGERARVAVQIVALAPGASPESLSVRVEDLEVAHTVERDAEGASWLAFDAPLSRCDYTIVTLHTPTMFCPYELGGGQDTRRLGLAVADIRIDPLT